MSDVLVLVETTGSADVDMGSFANKAESMRVSWSGGHTIRDHQ